MAEGIAKIGIRPYIIKKEGHVIKYKYTNGKKFRKKKYDLNKFMENKLSEKINAFMKNRK